MLSEAAPAPVLHARFQLSTTQRVKFYGSPMGDEALKVSLYGVRDDPFGPATPQANLEMTLVPLDAQAMFGANVPLGKQYDVTFTPIPDEPA